MDHKIEQEPTGFGLVFGRDLKKLLTGGEFALVVMVREGAEVEGEGRRFVQIVGPGLLGGKSGLSS